MDFIPLTRTNSRASSGSTSPMPTTEAAARLISSSFAASAWKYSTSSSDHTPLKNTTTTGPRAVRMLSRSCPPWALGRLNSGASAPTSGTATFCLRRVNMRPSLRVRKILPRILQATRALGPAAGCNRHLASAPPEVPAPHPCSVRAGLGRRFSGSRPGSAMLLSCATDHDPRDMLSGTESHVQSDNLRLAGEERDQVVEVEQILRDFGLILGAGLVAQFVATFLRIPEMIVLVAVGALVGPSVLGIVENPLNGVGAQLLFTIGVAMILFHGGVGISLRVISRTAIGLGLLVLPGVAITAFIVAAVVAPIFGVSLLVALMIGAVLASTDPAIIIPLFERLGLRPKVSQTVIAESAFNDVTGTVLTLTLVSAVEAAHFSVSGP